MEVIEERLGDTAKNVLRVLRSMVVLMHLLCKGPEACVLWAVKKIDLIKSIRQFANVDEDKRNIGRHGENRILQYWRTDADDNQCESMLQK